jgi:hypothetical protein
MVVETLPGDIFIHLNPRVQNFEGPAKQFCWLLIENHSSKRVLHIFIALRYLLRYENKRIFFNQQKVEEVCCNGLLNFLTHLFISIITLHSLITCVITLGQRRVDQLV